MPCILDRLVAIALIALAAPLRCSAAASDVKKEKVAGRRRRRPDDRRRAPNTAVHTVMRPAHPVQRVTSTSKVRRKKVARFMRESGA